MSQREFARSRDIKHANLNKFLTGAKSLSPEIKAAIFTGWTDHETGQMLFDAHIQDEMKAARIPYKLPSEIELATAIVNVGLSIGGDYNVAGEVILARELLKQFNIKYKIKPKS